MRRTFVATALSFAVFASSRLASAAPTEFSAAAIGGVVPIAPPLAFGLRAGATFLEGAYAGATFMYHPANLVGESSSSRLWYTGVEAGYESGDFPKTRVFLGGGYGRRKIDHGGVMADGSIPPPPPWLGSVVLWPGLAVLFPVGPAFVGLDARIIFWLRPERDDSPSAGVPTFVPAGFLTAGAKF